MSVSAGHANVELPDYSATIVKRQSEQKKIDDIGYRLLNANKIDKRMVFLYKNENKKVLKDIPGLTKRQIIVYKNTVQFTSNEDETAAMLAREICAVNESYYGEFKGITGAVQTKLAPKKFEIYFDKRAVDYMVSAGYNPLGMITLLNKAYPQKRFDFIGRTNLTSKRLAEIYEYIFIKYPYFISNNTYIKNDVYQNFLLTSENNRLKLRQKIKNGTKAKVKYE